ncbi:hypothetical protein [Stratiformator vulcanicus]|uniref:Uncharacterized protein n=1 Tax=Stratiformator vulcanicus TaxID=2527980 RepID=A0A517QVJ2_9PLAN|nr:hypothetical protein [Stratiformator vulcanicus]QDT35666.1 hypothetical protein Pan189_00190 [Stratiformator vulcanicus]
MRMTHWLSRLAADDMFQDSRLGRRDPWRFQSTSYRSNPFKPPQRFGRTRQRSALSAGHHGIVHRRLA